MTNELPTHTLSGAEVTPVEMPGQTELQQYGRTDEGAIYLFSPAMGIWQVENVATRMVREARANGRVSSVERDRGQAWRFGENWMVRSGKAA